jgi:hypothetical protein
LDLNEQRFFLEKGYWVKFEAYEVRPDPQRPHGIKYSLTLHDRENNRVFGMDNAHAVKIARKKRFVSREKAFDHIHRLDQIEGYEFQSFFILLNDFWSNVSKIIGN